jgi:hypothetical protein
VEAQLEALAWLVENDGEFDWAQMPPDTDFVGAVRDNFRAFGFEHPGTVPPALAAALLARD